MGLLHTIASALLPIIFVTALGWFAGAEKIIKSEASSTLATFIIKFALPFSLFLGAATAKKKKF